MANSLFHSGVVFFTKIPFIFLSAKAQKGCVSASPMLRVMGHQHGLTLASCCPVECSSPLSWQVTGWLTKLFGRGSVSVLLLPHFPVPAYADLAAGWFLYGDTFASDWFGAVRVLAGPTSSHVCCGLRLRVDMSWLLFPVLNCLSLKSEGGSSLQMNSGV